MKQWEKQENTRQGFNSRINEGKEERNGTKKRERERDGKCIIICNIYRGEPGL